MNRSTNCQIILDAVLSGENYDVGGPCEIDIADGHIADIRPLDSGARSSARPRLLGMPSLVDAHNHARPLSTTSFGCGGQRLETWLPQLALIPSVDAYTAGRKVIKDGSLTGVDLSALEDSLRDEYRQAFTGVDDLSGIWAILKERICAHYQGCC